MFGLGIPEFTALLIILAIFYFLSKYKSKGKSDERGKVANAEPGVNGLRYSERDVQAIQTCAESVLRVFTESLNIANNSKNIKTRESRLRVTRDTLAELRKMERQYPFLHLTNLEAVEDSIAGVEAETREMSTAQSKTKIIATIEESKNNINKAWRDNQDIISGLQFIATLQLRTPLRVLLRHGEIHMDMNTEPPKIIKEMWEGIWTTKAKTYRELGCDIDEVPEGSHASNIGPVKPSEYLPFLIAVRKIVELDESIENRVAKLREMLPAPKWKEFVRKHGEAEKIVQYFFPRHIRPMPKLPASTVCELSRLGFDTPKRLASAADEVLLGMKGIGSAKLWAIREHCADMAKHRDADRVENVTR
ncbi:MAG: hypothetical protein Q8K00_08380 [Syntrophales bacterium]|nr:hypothetical protein [Syntrophales bacterium]